MRDYFPMLQAADSLAAYQGYLTIEDKKEHVKLESNFKRIRNSFVHNIIKIEGNSGIDILQSVERDINDYYHSIGGDDFSVNYIRSNLFPYLEKQLSKSPLRRKLEFWGPIAVGGLVVIAYFSIRFLSAIDVSQPVTTREGLVHRAQAVTKALRYEEWGPSHTHGKGRAVMAILTWPIEPSDEEMAGANEFFGIVLAGHQMMIQQKEACGPLAPGTNDAASEQQVALVRNVATYLQGENVKWLDPAPMTLLPPIKADFPCP